MKRLFEFKENIQLTRVLRVKMNSNDEWIQTYFEAIEFELKWLIKNSFSLLEAYTEKSHTENLDCFEIFWNNLERIVAERNWIFSIFGANRRGANRRYTEPICCLIDINAFPIFFGAISGFQDYSDTRTFPTGNIRTPDYSDSLNLNDFIVIWITRIRWRK